MNTHQTERQTESDAEAAKFYLPAGAISQKVSKIETFLTDRLGRHGLVPIPSTYNE